MLQPAEDALPSAAAPPLPEPVEPEVDPVLRAGYDLLKTVSGWARQLGVPLADPSLPQSENERLALYSAALRQAEGEDYSSFAALECVHLGRRDRQGRRVVVLTGRNMPLWACLDKEAFRRFVYASLCAVVREPYVVVYLHSDTEKVQRPGAQWLMNSFVRAPVWLCGAAVTNSAGGVAGCVAGEPGRLLRRAPRVRRATGHALCG